MKKEEERLCDCPGYQQNSVRRYSQHYERAEMMVVSLSTQRSSLLASGIIPSARGRPPQRAVNSTRSGRFFAVYAPFLPPPSSPPKNETDAATRMSKGSAVILRTKHDPHNPLSATGLQAGRRRSRTRLHAPLLRGCLRLTTCSADQAHPLPCSWRCHAGGNARRRRNGVVIRFWRQVFAIPVLCCAALIYGEAPWVQTRVCEPKW